MRRLGPFFVKILNFNKKKIGGGGRGLKTEYFLGGYVDFLRVKEQNWNIFGGCKKLKYLFGYT